MKKILVNVNDENLELIRNILEKRMGTKQSNSDIVNHLMFDFLVQRQVIKIEDFFCQILTGN